MTVTMVDGYSQSGTLPGHPARQLACPAYERTIPHARPATRPLSARCSFRPTVVSLPDFAFSWAGIDILFSVFLPFSLFPLWFPPLYKSFAIDFDWPCITPHSAADIDFRRSIATVGELLLLRPIPPGLAQRLHGTATEFYVFLVRHDITYASSELKKTARSRRANCARQNLSINSPSLPRLDLMRQVQEVLDLRHKGVAGILSDSPQRMVTTGRRRCGKLG